MTEHLTMNTVIHAAFRRDFARFDDALAAFPAGLRSRADQLSAAWDNLAFQLRHHHEDEETIFWPAMREVGVDEHLMSDLGGEHERMLTALASADTSMTSFRADPTGPNAVAAREAVRALQAALLEHLVHEERDLEPLMFEHAKDAPLVRARDEVRKAHKGGLGTFIAWLRDDADGQVRAMLDTEIPPPVQFVVMRTSGRRYTRTIAPTWS